jgi:hypothetical protein
MGLRATIVDRLTGRSARVSDAGALVVSSFGGSGEVAEYRTRHLRTEAGVAEAAVDGSVTAVEFFVRPPPGEIWRVARLMVFLEASSIAAGAYGPVPVGALANGVRVYTANDFGELNDLLDIHTITTSAGWAEYCHDAQVKSWGAGNEFLTVRWTFTKAGVPIRLRGDNRERLDVLVQDDLTGLDSHQFIVQGYREGEVHV